MSKYTVVIARDEPHGATAEHPRLTLHVDVGKPRPRVTSVSVALSGPEGLTSANLPDIDLTAVVEALVSTLGARDAQSQLSLFEKTSTSAPTVVQSAASPTDTAAPASGPDRERPKSAPSSAKSHESADSAAGRHYRRMPDPDELRGNLERIGTVTGLAKHYDVPRYTAQGWVGRLKKLDSSVSGLQAMSEPTLS